MGQTTHHCRICDDQIGKDAYDNSGLCFLCEDHDELLQQQARKRIDEFALAALTSIAGSERWVNATPASTAHQAYRLAKAMEDERVKLHRTA